MLGNVYRQFERAYMAWVAHERFTGRASREQTQKRLKAIDSLRAEYMRGRMESKRQGGKTA